MIQELKRKLEIVLQQNGAAVDQRDLNDDLLAIRTGLVTLHGEVVLMESYSTLNYTGFLLGNRFCLIGIERSRVEVSTVQ